VFLCNEVSLQVILLPKSLATKLIGFLCCNEVTLPQLINFVDKQSREIKPLRVTWLPINFDDRLFGNEVTCRGRISLPCLSTKLIS